MMMTRLYNTLVVARVVVHCIGVPLLCYDYEQDVALPTHPLSNRGRGFFWSDAGG